MKIIYNNAEVSNNIRDYNTLINKPSLNGVTLQNNVSLDTLSMYDKPTTKKLVDATSQIRLVTEMPADPEPNMTYYVGPDERQLYDVILVNDAKQQIHMGTTQFGQYKSGPGVNVKFDNTININTDDVSMYIDSEGNLASSLDGEALPAFTGATSSLTGTKGLVPKPLAGEQDLPLFGNSSWSILNIVNLIYPVGSIYISNTDSVDPNVIFNGSVWTKLDSGYVLWNDTDGGGGTIRDGLPNITGRETGNIMAHSHGTNNLTLKNGCLTWYGAGKAPSVFQGGSGNAYGNLVVDFSKLNSIYGQSDVVQPPAYKIVAWQRTA